MVMNDLYETTFGFFDQLSPNPNRPLSSVAIFDTEMNGYNSRLYYLFQKYKEANIKKHFDLNLLEFINLPREQIEWLFTLASEFERSDTKASNELLNELTAPPVK
jgi:hypothetical protein